MEKFPFRIRTIRTGRGHEFQALFHWHVADLGMEHVYIKPLASFSAMSRGEKARALLSSSQSAARGAQSCFSS